MSENSGFGESSYLRTDIDSDLGSRGDTDTCFDTDVNTDLDNDLDTGSDMESVDTGVHPDTNIDGGSLSDFDVTFDSAQENSADFEFDDVVYADTSEVSSEENDEDYDDGIVDDQAQNIVSDIEKNELENKDNSQDEELEIENQKIVETEKENLKDILSPQYEEAKTYAKESETGRLYTDHKEAHIEMVAEKSLEVGDAISKAVENGNLTKASDEEKIGFSSDIDKKTLAGASLSHDTGMKGSGYALVKNSDGTYGVIDDDKFGDDYVLNSKKTVSDLKDMYKGYGFSEEQIKKMVAFDVVRDNHSFNSAINLLIRRDEYREAGYSDEQIDKMAAECMAHSKSCSGVRDLNSKEEWRDCFKKIEAAVKANNADENSVVKINFNRNYFEGNDKKWSSLVSETLALRVGDVSRDSKADAESQSGEKVHVNRSTINNHSLRADLEYQDADITIGDNNEPVYIPKSRMISVGEQNIMNNHTYVGRNGTIIHEITVADGESATRCTHCAIQDHMGELATATSGDFVVEIKFSKAPNDFTKILYDLFNMNEATNYPNVTVRYPWSKGD